MRHFILLGVCAILGLLFFVNSANAAKKTQSVAPTPVPEEEDFFVGPNWSDMFDWKLLKAFKSQKNRNVIISPISIKIVLALLYGGSASVTKEQLQRVLNFHEDAAITDQHYKNIVKSLQQKHHNFTLNLGTRIFMKLKPQQKFQSNAKTIYDADIDELDFDNVEEASKVINKWVDHITEGHIRKLVHAEDLHRVVMLVANAVYFKGTWLKQFPQSGSHRGQFYISSNNTVQVDYMAQSDYFYYGDSKELQARIVRVPYQGDHYVMYFVLPNYKTGLANLVDSLSPDVLRRCLNLTDLTYVDLVIPKFKFDFQSKMDDVLSELGLDSMFSPTASFPGIVRGDTVKLAVSSIVQKAGIEVNEEGTTAFAATDVQVVNKFGDVQGVFNATHPFLFFIEDRITGTILFSGKVENPIQSDAQPLDQLPAPAPAGPAANSVPLSADAQYPYQYPSTPKPARAPSNAVSQPQPSPLSPQDSARFNYFDFEILKNVDRDHENVFLSPASIKATLAMILEGARGESARQIEKILRVGDVSEARLLIKDIIYGLMHTGRTVLETGHGIFVSDQYHNDHVFDDFRNIIKNNYKASVDRVPFSNPGETSHIVNTWVAKITNGLITDILTPDNFNENTGLVLASALYFKGDWKYEFNPTQTQVRTFHTRTRGDINVDMMHITETFNYDLNQDIDAHVVQLPYSDDTYSMLIMVPRTKVNNNILSDLLHTNLRRIISQMEPTEVVLHLPKFDIDYSTDLKDVLKQMGVRDIFSKSANLSGIVSAQQVSIDALVHRARIQVGEKGTIAAAVTAASVVPLIGSSSPLVSVDQPFVFVIYNKLKQHIIFEGVVNEPTEVAAAAPPAHIPQVRTGGSSGRVTPIQRVQHQQQQPSYEPQQKQQQQPYNQQQQQESYEQQLRTSNPVYTHDGGAYDPHYGGF